MPFSIGIYSDLHLEFFELLGRKKRTFDLPETDADVIVLAGDIHTGTRGVEWAIKQSSRLKKPFVYVFGNHEYYDHHLGILEKARSMAKKSGGRVHVLDNESVVLDGVRFLGCTLWTDLNLYGNAPLSEADALSSINDFRKIRVPPQFRRLRPSDTRYLHQQSKVFLESREDFQGATVVVTHHAPSDLSIPENYRGSSISPCYASRMEDLVSKFDLWIHGHIHESMDYRIGNCRVVSNPHGYYPFDINPEFDAMKIVEVPYGR